MPIITFFRLYLGKRFIFAQVLSLLSGGTNALVLILIGKNINHYITYRDFSYNHISLLIVSFCIFIMLNRFTAAFVVTTSQKVVHRLRIEIVEKVLQLSFPKMEKEVDNIYNLITKDVDYVSRSVLLLLYVCTSFCLVFICFVYLIFCSPALFYCMIVFFFVGVVLYLVREKKIGDLFLESRNRGNDLIKVLNDILYGFKEIKVNPLIGNRILNLELRSVSKLMTDLNAKGQIDYLDNMVVGQMILFAFITFTLLFGNQIIPDSSSGVLISYIITLLYILGPIESAMQLIPQIALANISAKKILAIINELKQDSTPVKDASLSTPAQMFSLCVEDLSFKYSNNKKEHDFEIGPVNLEISKGEIIFIRGGNGSGKTTFMKSLLQLYTAQKGRLLINNQTISRATYLSYFVPVFSEFYLFDQLYHLEEAELQKFQQYAEYFELDKKVFIKERRLSTTNLSKGQRKRLSLICALLQKREILMLDEWAADQSPRFRQKFYTQLLPKLKAEGITIIAITHDDHYFHCADRLFKMEHGQLLEG